MPSDVDVFRPERASSWVVDNSEEPSKRCFFFLLQLDEKETRPPMKVEVLREVWPEKSRNFHENCSEREQKRETRKPVK